jgi:uncharacterized protein YjbJ (UPF0337 family)
MERNRKEGALERALATLKEKTDRLLGRRPTPAKGEEEEVERELRETYDKPADTTRARSAFRQ